eukprot:1834522-Amphidinium_carterae.1
MIRCCLLEELSFVLCCGSACHITNRESSVAILAPAFAPSLTDSEALQVMCQTATVSDASWTPTMLKRLGTNLLGSDGGSNDGYFRNSGV